MGYAQFDFNKLEEAQPQKHVVQFNKVSRVSDRPTCPTFCCIKMSKNDVVKNNEFCFFIKVAYVPPSFRLQRYNMNTPKSKFFRHSISHLHFLNLQKLILIGLYSAISEHLLNAIKTFIVILVFCLCIP